MAKYLEAYPNQTLKNISVTPLYQRSLAIFEKALGPEHPHVAAHASRVMHEFG